MSGLILALLSVPVSGAPVDVAPFGTPLPEGNGVVWEDPREIHRVVVRFKGVALSPERVRLEYWSSRWPEQRLPKDREPGGGSVGWWELGNWYTGGWRTADTVTAVEGSIITFTFRPVNAHEFPNLADFPATFRTTLKIRVVSEDSLPPIESIQAYTDSVWEQRTVRLVWQQASRSEVKLEAFNGIVEGLERLSPRSFRAHLWIAKNSDPNTFDRTLITVRRGRTIFTFAVNDLSQGPLFLPFYQVAVLPGDDERDYAAIAAEQKARGAKTLYDRVAAMPEQTWQAAWEGMPPKRSPIYLPLGLDGGRQRFRLDPDGSVLFRTNDHYLQNRPGKDTPRLALEKAPARFRFGLPDRPSSRTIEASNLPIAHSTWEVEGVRVQQTAFVTLLEGVKADDPPPPGDAFAVFLARFTFTNSANTSKTATFRTQYESGEQRQPLSLDEQGRVWVGEHLRAQVVAEDNHPLPSPPPLQRGGRNGLSGIGHLHPANHGWWS